MSALSDRIVDARLAEYFADDWGQVRIDGTLVASRPKPLDLDRLSSRPMRAGGELFTLIPISI
jgi:hypothetical protein